MISRSMVALVALGAGWASGCSGNSYSAPGARSASAHPAAYESAAAEGSYDADDGGGADSAQASGESYEPAPDRPGLGTQFGEEVHSRVVQRRFERAAAEPFAEVAVHYNDAEGVSAQAEYRSASLAPISAATPQGGLSISVTDEYGNPLTGFSAGGRTYVVGQAGQRYVLRVSNHTGGRFELVASVDGLDVIDGRPAALGKRGYLIDGHRTITIDGFRTSGETVAAFRFASVRESYASRTGGDRNVGVLGFAFFAERGSQWTSDELARRESADPFPARYSVPPPN